MVDSPQFRIFLSNELSTVDHGLPTISQINIPDFAHKVLVLRRVDLGG